MSSIVGAGGVASNILNGTGTTFGDIHTAQSATAAKARCGEDAPQFGPALAWLGDLFRSKNHLAEAEPLLRGDLASYEKSFGPDHPTMAILRSDLAGLLKTMDNLLPCRKSI